MIYLLSKPEKVDEHEEKREDAKSGALTLVPVPMAITCHDIITRNLSYYHQDDLSKEGCPLPITCTIMILNQIKCDLNHNL